MSSSLFEVESLGYYSDGESDGSKNDGEKAAEDGHLESGVVIEVGRKHFCCR